MKNKRAILFWLPLYGVFWVCTMGLAEEQPKMRDISFHLFSPDKQVTTGEITLIDENGAEKIIVIDHDRYTYTMPDGKYFLRAESKKFQNITLELDINSSLKPEIHLRFQKRKEQQKH
ncbi:MAG: hypothetical protein KDK51_06325 [Deltaproteobacteria bacterium]|nr:hypothetical protein [Deltaproteobacteria bacterium]